MALKWSIVIPTPFSNGPSVSPGQYSINSPVAVYSSANSPYGGYDTQTLALDAFMSNFATLLNFYAWNTPIRVTYPNVAGSPVTQVLSSYGGYYTQYSHSVILQRYTCTLYTTNFPAGFTISIYLYQAPEESAPPVPPATVTIQLKRDNTISKYSVKPSDAAVLRKYDDPVKFIRAKFLTTRTAVITETLTGGFMIYEESSPGVATGPIYIYSSKRKLVTIALAADINQYRLYTF